MYFTYSHFFSIGNGSADYEMSYNAENDSSTTHNEGTSLYRSKNFGSKSFVK